MDKETLERLEKQKPWERFGITRDEFMANNERRLKREEGVPSVGALAPEFKAERLDTRGRRTGETFTFNAKREKPVALVFGSYT